MYILKWYYCLLCRAPFSPHEVMCLFEFQTYEDEVLFTCDSCDSKTDDDEFWTLVALRGHFPPTVVCSVSQCHTYAVFRLPSQQTQYCKRHLGLNVEQTALVRWLTE